MKRASKIYHGRIRHRRFTPKLREFSHSVCYFYLDTKEIDTLFNKPGLFAVRGPSLFGFRRRAYLGPRDIPLDEAVRKKVSERIGYRPEGSIRVLSQIAYLEFAFNPVCFYYCFTKDGEMLEAIVAEITNTPWNERYAYVMDCRKYDPIARMKFSFNKAFHVSPFLPMELHYEWNFSHPGERLKIHMVNLSTDANSESKPVFDATLTLEAREWNFKNLIKSLAFQPAMTFKTFLWIYVHAGILYIKGHKVFTHPAKLQKAPHMFLKEDKKYENGKKLD